MDVEYYQTSNIIVRREVGKNQSYAEVNIHQLHLLLTTSASSSTSYHEVCYYTGTAKPRFDIEGIFLSESECRAVKDELLKNLEAVLRRSIDEDFSFKVYDSCGSVMNRFKMSMHVVCNGIHHNVVKSSDSFCLRVIGLIDRQYTEYFDKAVYGKNHSLRVLGCWKDNRRKVPLNAEPSTYELTIEDLAASLVTYSRNSTSLNNVSSLVEDDKAPVDLPENILTIVQKNIPSEFKYRNALVYHRDKTVIYDVNLTRLRPSFCNMCNRVHEKDNTLMIHVEVQPDGQVSVALRCRRQSTKTTIDTIVMKKTTPASPTIFEPPTSIDLRSIIRNKYGIGS